MGCAWRGRVLGGLKAASMGEGRDGLGLVFDGDRSLWFNSQAPCPSSHSWGLHRSLLGLVTPCPVLPAGGQPSQVQLPSHTSLLHSLQDAPPSSRKPPPPSPGIPGNPVLGPTGLLAFPGGLSDMGPEFLASPLLSPNPSNVEPPLGALPVCSGLRSSPFARCRPHGAGGAPEAVTRPPHQPASFPGPRAQQGLRTSSRSLHFSFMLSALQL